MPEVGVAELYAGCSAPILRHQVPPCSVERAWLAGGGRAALWWGPGANPAGPSVVATAVGAADALAELFEEAADSVAPPGRLTVEAAGLTVVPQPWRHEHRWSWHWMTVTDTAFHEAAVPVGAVVVDLAGADDEQLLTLLTTGHPDSIVRPGAAGILTWHGIWDLPPTTGTSHTLVAAAALVAQPDGSGLLRGVTVHPLHRGRGLGTAVSASLTRRALELAPVAALGVYVDNAPALAIYEGLGYRVAHSFVSGPTQGSGSRSRSSTTAAVPSPK